MLASILLYILVISLGFVLGSVYMLCRLIKYAPKGMVAVYEEMGGDVSKLKRK